MIVVAAVIEDSRGRVLLAQRPPGKQDAGLWEFPGGKIEAGESARAALARELREELALDVFAATRFMRVRQTRPSGPLTLEAWRVCAWQGDPVAHEHSALAWCEPGELLARTLCAADVPIARTLQLPPCYAITPLPERGNLRAFFARVESALQCGLRLLQWRAPGLDAAEFRDIAIELLVLTRRHGARLLLNAEPELARELGADGVHLSAARMRSIAAPIARDHAFLVAASCHDAVELALAQQLGVDFVVVSPIRATASHADATPLGWQRLHELLEASDVPAYALGGVGPGDVAAARASGAIGVAGINAFW